MDTAEIRKEIASLINSIKEHADTIKDNTFISPSELESMLTKIRNLHEKTILLNHLSSIPETSQPANVIKPAEISTPTIDLFGSELPSVPAKPKREKKTEEKIVVNKIQKPSINDLKAEIGVNDQFQFANELFEGSMQEYNIAIQQLNTAETLESAIDYFSNLQQLYNWDESNETAKRLLDLIDRKYSA